MRLGKYQRESLEKHLAKNVAGQQVRIGIEYVKHLNRWQGGWRVYIRVLDGSDYHTTLGDYEDREIAQKRGNEFLAEYNRMKMKAQETK